MQSKKKMLRIGHPKGGNWVILLGEKWILMSNKNTKVVLEIVHINLQYVSCKTE